MIIESLLSLERLVMSFECLFVERELIVNGFRMSLQIVENKFEGKFCGDFFMIK